MKKKSFFLISFILGFLLASYWNGGRSFVRKFTPFVVNSIEDISDSAKDVYKKSSAVAKEAIKKY